MIACMGVDFLRECFDADFVGGLLRWKARPASHFADAATHAGWVLKCAGKPAGGPHKEGYMVVYVSFRGQRKGMLVHRVLWAMKHGTWPAETIDHIDRNRVNNAETNLRLATYSDQNANRAAMRNGLKGATYEKRTGRWIAQACRGGRNYFFGRFQTEAEAHLAYMEGAKRLHGEFASC